MEELMFILSVALGYCVKGAVDSLADLQTNFLKRKKEEVQNAETVRP